MYSAERRREILKLIEKDSRVSVADLAAHFGVSRATIRRDLNHLDGSGLLQRTYGGALPPGSLAAHGFSEEAPFSERRIANQEEKDRIGRFAAQLVQPGETIFVDGGTTTECMVPYLAGRAGVTVVTFGLNIANRLLPCEGITVIVVGGMLDQRSLTLGGVLALDFVQAYNMRYDRAFVAASGVSADGGVTNARLEQIPMKRRSIEAARQSILLADKSKLGVIATGLIVPADDIDRLVTGAGAPSDEVAALRELGVTIDMV